MNTKQLSTPQLILLHLVPIVLALIVRLIVVPIVAWLRLPPRYGSIRGGVLVLSFELGYMLFLGKKMTSKPSLKGIVLYREPLPWWQYVVFFVVLFAWSFGAMTVMAPLSKALHEKVFYWVPASYAQFDPSLYSQAILVVMVILFLILHPLAGAVEELYFHGYLLGTFFHAFMNVIVVLIVAVQVFGGI